MAADAPSSGGEFEHEAFISHAGEDRPWADRLQKDLNARGIFGIAANFTALKPGDVWSEALQTILGESRTLIVLWTPRSLDSAGVVEEIATFESVVANFSPRTSFAVQPERPRRLIIPLIFGREIMAQAPSELRSRQGIVISREVYAAGPDTWHLEWSQAVEEIAQVLSESAPESAAPATESSGPEEASSLEQEAPPLEPTSEAGLGQMRAWVMRGDRTEPGWMLSERLVIARTEEPPLDTPVPIRTEVGMTEGQAGAWPRSHREVLSSFAFLSLEPPLAVAQPLALGPTVPDRAIEFWNWPLKHASASGQVGERNEDGSFDLVRSDAGAIEDGAAIWDTQGGCFLGIASHAGGRRWRLWPAMTIQRLVESSERPGPIAPPSARIHDDSWTIDDRLGYSLYAHAITKFIQHPDTKPPLVIGVQGPWGQGKTSLMRLAQERLDPGHADLMALRDQEAAPAEADGPSEMTLGDLRDSLDGDIDLGQTQPPGIRSVWFNPWKYQSSEALWAGLAHAILTQLPARLPRAEQELFWLKLQLRRIDAAAVRRDIHRLIFDRLLPGLLAAIVVAIAVAVVLAAVGASAALDAAATLVSGGGIAAVSWLTARRKTLESGLEGNYRRYVSEPDYVGKLGYFHQVEEDMRRALALLAPGDEPTVIFIDDLDRCSATKISEVLEAINLFLSGEYPNCIFVLGIDAQVVASAMETVHRHALGEDEGKADDLKGNLGWRFLDKFIQLSFVMPRPSQQQRQDYLATLLGVEPPAVEGEGNGGRERASADVDAIRRELADGELRVEDATRRVGQLSNSPGVERDQVQRVAEEVITLGAEKFSDADRETVEALQGHFAHLSDNPRTIKRAVNLYRFYRFIAWAREASSPDLTAAEPELIASWTVIAARWPQAVHWLQVNGRQSEDPEVLLRTTWQEEEPELCDFLTGEEALDLREAMACGLW
jgi:hypothetical protein